MYNSFTTINKHVAVASSSIVITSTNPSAANIYSTNKALLPTLRIRAPLNGNDYAPINFYFKSSKAIASSWTFEISSATLALTTSAQILCRVSKFSQDPTPDSSLAF